MIRVTPPYSSQLLTLVLSLLVYEQLSFRWDQPYSEWRRLQVDSVVQPLGTEGIGPV